MSRAPLPWRSTLGAVVIAADDGPLVIRGVAAHLWDLLDQPRAVASVLDALQDEWPDLSRSDVASTLAELIDRSVVVT